MTSVRPPGDRLASTATRTARPTEDARERSLMAGLRLFVHPGFAKTPTRELADAAEFNVAGIGSRQPTCSGSRCAWRRRHGGRS